MSLCYGVIYRRPTTELLSLMVVMLEGLGFNLCVTPFLKSVSLIYLRGSRMENVGGGQSWVRGIILESDEGRLSGVIVRTKANEN